jgi:hypothetical protein
MTNSDKATELQLSIGSRIRVTVDCESDLRDAGMGVELCASKGEELIVRGHSPYSEGRIYVSHEHVTDRSFSVDRSEYEVVPSIKPSNICTDAARSLPTAPKAAENSGRSE